MRKRCRGMPLQWLGGLILIALGLGMLLACLLPKCVVLSGILLIGIGIWLLVKCGG